MPGPELADAQSAETELMPFPVIDACLHLYAAEKMSPGEVEHALVSLFPETTRAQAHQWASRFARMFTQSIYKWVQSPLSLHVGSLDLERERALQMPVVQKTEWTNGGEVGKAGRVDKASKAGKAGAAGHAAKRPDS
jgi:NAD+ synthase (glutamine-hydrolysing)